MAWEVPLLLLALSTAFAMANAQFQTQVAWRGAGALTQCQVSNFVSGSATHAHARTCSVRDFTKVSCLWCLRAERRRWRPGASTAAPTRAASGPPACLAGASRCVLRANKGVILIAQGPNPARHDASLCALAACATPQALLPGAPSTLFPVVGAGSSCQDSFANAVPPYPQVGPTLERAMQAAHDAPRPLVPCCLLALAPALLP